MFSTLKAILMHHRFTQWHITFCCEENISSTKTFLSQNFDTLPGYNFQVWWLMLGAIFVKRRYKSITIRNSNCLKIYFQSVQKVHSIQPNYMYIILWHCHIIREWTTLDISFNTKGPFTLVKSPVAYPGNYGQPFHTWNGLLYPQSALANGHPPGNSHPCSGVGLRCKTSAACESHRE